MTGHLLLLIFLTQNAKKKVACDPFQLEDEFEGKPIRLYNIRNRRKPNDIGPIALPLSAGRVCILTKKSNKNYFRCIDVYQNCPAPHLGADYFHELMGNVKITVPEVESSAEGYLHEHDAINCEKIMEQVKNRKEWDIRNAQSGTKWQKYFEVREKIISERQFEAWATISPISERYAEATFKLGEKCEKNEEFEKKIEGACGEDMKFSFSPEDKMQELGKLDRIISREKIGIQLDKNFQNLLSEIDGKHFYPDWADESKNTNVTARETTDDDTPGGAESKNEDAKKCHSMICQLVDSGESKFGVASFYHDKNRQQFAFSCYALQSGDIWKIDRKTVEPRFKVSVNFDGDLYQIGVMKSGLSKIRKRTKIWDVLSMGRLPSLPTHARKISWRNDAKLNDEQKDAVERALSSKEIFLIWGPPGTGKTQVISEIACQMAINGRKTLIASQANLAVDNALARLHDKPEIKSFRSARDQYAVEGEDKDLVPMENTIHKFFIKHLLRDIKRESDNNLDKQGHGEKIRKTFMECLERRLKYYNQNRSIDEDGIEERERKQLMKLYNNRINVVGGTLLETGKSKKFEKLGIKKFDMVIIDEASKAMHPEIYLPILLSAPEDPQVIIVGDHKQLPPTIKRVSGDEQPLSEAAEDVNLPLDTDATLFEDLWKWYRNDARHACVMLTKQYRMHEDIQKLIAEFYHGKLECGLDSETLESMKIEKEGFFSDHAIWIDTGPESWETRKGTSFYNESEIKIVQKLLDALPKNRNMSIGVITFYAAQLDRLRNKCEKKYREKFGPQHLIFGTVDRFQGRECDVVICSLVRRNRKGNIGFAAKPNRINVAFSRARRLLCIVGNREQFVYQDIGEIYGRIYKYATKRKERDIPHGIGG